MANHALPPSRLVVGLACLQLGWRGTTHSQVLRIQVIGQFTFIIYPFATTSANYLSASLLSRLRISHGLTKAANDAKRLTMRTLVLKIPYNLLLDERTETSFFLIYQGSTSRITGA
jgi:hypothetical protein